MSETISVTTKTYSFTYSSTHDHFLVNTSDRVGKVVIFDGPTNSLQSSPSAIDLDNVVHDSLNSIVAGASTGGSQNGGSISNGSHICKLAGKYLVMWDAKIDFNNNGTSNTPEYWTLGLHVNGTYAGGGQTGTNGGDNTSFPSSYANGAAILDLAAEDDVTLEIIDFNTTQSESFVAGSLKFIKLDDDWNYIRLSKTGSTTAFGAAATWQNVTWEVQDEYDSAVFTHSTSVNSDEITFDSSGNYLLIPQMAYTGTAARAVQHQMHDIDSFARPALQQRVPSVDVRSCTIQMVGSDSNNDYALRTQILGASTTGAAIDNPNCILDIVRIPPDVDVLFMDSNNSPTPSGGTADQELDWSNNYSGSLGSMTWSSSPNPERIEIDQDGDYLVMFSPSGYSGVGSTESAEFDLAINGTNTSYNNTGYYEEETNFYTNTAMVAVDVADTDYLSIQYTPEGTTNSFYYSTVEALPLHQFTDQLPLGPNVVQENVVTYNDVFVKDDQAISVDTLAYSVDNALDHTILDPEFIEIDTDTWTYTLNDIVLIANESAEADTASWNVTYNDVEVFEAGFITVDTAEYTVQYQELVVFGNELIDVDTSSWTYTVLDVTPQESFEVDTKSYDYDIDNEQTIAAIRPPHIMIWDY